MTPKTSPIALVRTLNDPESALLPALELLHRMGCEPVERVISILTSPDRVIEWVANARDTGVRVLIVAAGCEPQTPALLAAATSLPVIAVPLSDESDPDGGACLHSLLQTHAQAPLAIVRPDDAAQAAMLALRMLAMSDPIWMGALRQDRHAAVARLDRMQNETSGPSIIDLTRGDSAGDDLPVNFHFPESPPTTTESSPKSESTMREAGPDEDTVRIRKVDLERPLEEVAAETRNDLHLAKEPPPPARKLGRMLLTDEIPEPEMVEEIVDCLLEGGIIALPTDTVYGLAADATNPRAVERLFEIKGRDSSKPIVIFVDSPKSLASIARNVTVDLRRMTEAYWPGPLTIIFQKRAGNFDHIGSEDSIGVRMPDHSTPLSIMQSLSRPLACTSANKAGQPECRSADQVEAVFGMEIDALIDGGNVGDTVPSTVLDVTREPYRILRAGTIRYDQLETILGDKLDSPDSDNQL